MSNTDWALKNTVCNEFHSQMGQRERERERERERGSVLSIVRVIESAVAMATSKKGQLQWPKSTKQTGRKNTWRPSRRHWEKKKSLCNKMLYGSLVSGAWSQVFLVLVLVLVLLQRFYDCFFLHSCCNVLAIFFALHSITRRGHHSRRLR